uniref:FAST kinase leucine-rich domain-containing protein n=1 Tax=Tetradesmus obliquus TaxID=3088 RepID=A0A383V8C0_TETOB|eukprot:jgi/Sobl393_1/3510/SZX60999.1
MSKSRSSSSSSRTGSNNAVNPRHLTVDIKQATTVRQLQQLVQRHGSSMDHIHLAATVNTLGNWQQRGKLSSSKQQVQQLLAGIEQLPRLQQLLVQCRCWQLSQLVWGLGLLGHTHTGLFGACLNRFMQRQHDIDRSQHVSVVLYGAAKAGWQIEPGQVQQLLAALVRLLPGADPQAVANSLLAVATMGQTPTEQQLQQLLAALMRLLPDAHPRAVANSLWAAATMGGKVQMQQLQLLLQHLTSRLADVNPQDVANSLWAVAKLAQKLTEQQQQLQQLQNLQQLLASLASKLAAATPQAVANSLWACAQLRVYPAELFAALDSQQQWGRLLPAMTGQALANTALACAVLGHRDERLPAGLLQHALQLQTSSDAQLDIQAVCNLCWSVAVLDLQQQAGSVVQLVQAAASGQQQFIAEDLRQLHQAAASGVAAGWSAGGWQGPGRGPDTAAAAAVQ